MNTNARARCLRWLNACWQLVVLACCGLLVMFIGYGTVLETVPIDDPAAGALGARLMLDLLLGTIMLALFVLRRRALFRIACAVMLLSLFSTFGVPVAIIMLVQCAARRHAVRIAVVAILFLISGAIDITFYPIEDETPLWEAFMISAVMTAVLVMIGLLIGFRRQLRETRVERATAEAQEQIERAQHQERARIAREMHDVLGHRLSLTAVHAGALEHREDLTREQTAQAAKIIGESTRQALDDLRGVLGVLRADTTGDVDRAPQPTAADIPQLIAEARASGSSVTVEHLELESVPESLGRHVFRMVQEFLTNARKHAPGTTATMSLTATPSDAVRLLVSNPCTADPDAGGYGLTGVAERARLMGGTLNTEYDGHSFRAEVSLPWPA